MSKVKKEKELTPDEKLKYEIAEELGLYELVKSGGWKALTAKQSGQIGGMMARRKRENAKKNNQFPEDKNGGARKY